MFFSATCIIFFHTFIFQPRMFIREVVNWHLSPGSETREKIILGAVLMRRARRSRILLARSFHTFLCVAQCLLWQLALQYAPYAS